MSNNAKFFVEPHRLAHAEPFEPVLVALSGGADSTCLLHLLADYSKRVGCKVYAAHVNHNIRTDAYANEAQRDEQFCRELCSRLDVKLFVHSIDVPALAKQTGESLETAARDARYSFFAEIMDQNGIKILATAHNADDNLETQIFNLCRGCSTEGLCGIPRQRAFPAAENAVVVRPILDATKTEILEYCASQDIDYVTDSTNLKDDCTRNRIRHNVIPELVSLFGSPQRAAMRLSRSAQEDSLFIRTHAEEFICDQDGNMPVDSLCQLHPAVAGRVLSIIFKQRFGAALEAVHIDAIMGILRSGKEGASTSLPCHARAAIKRGFLVLEDDIKQQRSAPENYDIALCCGINLICGSPFAIVVCTNGAEPDTKSLGDQYTLYTETCIYCTDPNTLRAKNRREGDTVLSGGMHKRLKKLMCDKKVDVCDRDTLPILYEGDEIILVPLCAVADSAKKQQNKQKANIYIFKKINGEPKL